MWWLRRTLGHYDNTSWAFCTIVEGGKSENLKGSTGEIIGVLGKSKVK